MQRVQLIYENVAAPGMFLQYFKKNHFAIRGLRYGRANFEVAEWILSFIRPSSPLIKGRRLWPGRCIGLREAPRIGPMSV